jgi:hypothetical protein
VEKHRIAAGLAKRAYPLAKAKLEQQNNGVNHGTTEQAQVPPETAIPPVEAPVESEAVIPTVEAPTQSEPVVAPVPLPEAKASANVYLTIAGRKVQLTLRDHDEENLLSRMEKLLSRFPMLEQEPEQQTASTPPAEDFCSIHQVQMKRYSNAKGSWLSHKTPEGTWCNGKNGKGK